MSSEAQIQARADRLDDAEYDSLKKSLHGIAARLDRLPIGSWPLETPLALRWRDVPRQPRYVYRRWSYRFTFGGRLVNH